MRRALLPALPALLLFTLPAGLAAQDGSEGAAWFPDTTAFEPLLIAPGEAGLLGTLIVTERTGSAEDFGGTNLETEVGLAWRQGIVRLQREAPGRPSVVLGFEFGILSRFFLETTERDLLGADFRVGAPLTFGSRGWEWRIELRHASSHFGDDYLVRFGITDVETFTRDGIEAFLARRFAGRGRAYGGAEVNFHANGNAERAAASAGVEWEGSRGREADGSWPFAAVDVRVTDETRGPSITAQAGVIFRVNGVGLAFGLRGHAGPSPLSRLQERDESYLGLGLRILP